MKLLHIIVSLIIMAATIVSEAPAALANTPSKSNPPADAPREAEAAPWQPCIMEAEIFFTAFWIVFHREKQDIKAPLWAVVETLNAAACNDMCEGGTPIDTDGDGIADSCS